MSFAVLAQAVPVVIDNGVAFALPIVLLLLTLAGALAESRWRVAQVEKRQDKLDDRQAALEKEQGETRTELDTTMAILGRVEKGVETIQREIREAVRRSA